MYIFSSLSAFRISQKQQNQYQSSSLFSSSFSPKAQRTLFSPFYHYTQLMASETEVPELSSSLFERLLRHRDFSVFLPFLLGFTATSQTGNTTPPQNPDQENERIVLINPFTQGMVVIEGAAGLESLLRDLATKTGHPPAAKASIDAMPSVEINDENGECAICLEEWVVGGVVKEMPCKHRFHANCVEKWLGIHGSCPLCRYKMPVDEELTKKREESEGGRDRRRAGREIWLNFSFNVSRRNGDSNQTPSETNNASSNSPTPDPEREDESNIL